MVSVSGRMDTLTAPEFEKAGTEWISEGCNDIVLDLADLEYISSAGLRSILAVAKRLLPTGGSFILCGMTGVVEEVFSISGFDSFLPVYATREEALSEK